MLILNFAYMLSALEAVNIVSKVKPALVITSYKQPLAFKGHPFHFLKWKELSRMNFTHEVTCL